MPAFPGNEKAPRSASTARGRPTVVNPQGNRNETRKPAPSGERAAAGSGTVPVPETAVQPMSDRLAAALRYAELGWRVFPVRAKGKKPAGLSVPNGLHDASSDPDVIRKWWTVEYPTANIGGVPPEGTYVLDVDIYDDLLLEAGPLGPMLANLHTPMQRSGGGGLHYLLRGPAPTQEALRNAWGSDRIDVKDHGKGYVLLAPSVHPETGALYEWGSSPDIEPADTPDWLLQGDARVAKDDAPTSQGANLKDRFSNGFIETALAPLGHQKPMGLDVSEARALLDKLPAEWCDEHDRWIKVGMALHFEFAGHPDALALWDAWSAGSDKYSPGHPENSPAARWLTFGKRSGPMATMATLVREVGRTAAPVQHPGLIRLRNPLGHPPQQVPYMIGSPVWLPDMAEQTMFYGKSDTFKSVAVQGLCAHLAAGIDIDGTPVPPRVVIYCAEEAPLLFDNNLHGWRLHFAQTLKGKAREHALRNLDAGYLMRVEGSLEGLTETRAKELADVVRRQQRALNSDARPVVVLDPMAEVMQGDENKTTDMRAFVNAGRIVQREADALVVHVHHEGHGDTGRERGSSALPSAMYARYQVRRPTPDAYVVEFHCRKHKAGAPRTPSRWLVQVVPLVPDADDKGGRPLTGVVIEHAGEAAPTVSAEEVRSAFDDVAIARLCVAYRRNPAIGRPSLLKVLDCGATKAERLRAEAVSRGLLVEGGGEGRAGYSLTKSGRALADRTIDDEDDPLSS